jgi:hypothetical protein
MCAQNQESNENQAVIICKKYCSAVPCGMYRMETMKYTLGALVNLFTLAAGITIGILLAPHLEKTVQATSADSQSSPANAAQPTSNTPEQITPGLTTGSMGTYLLLAHHVQSDELVVNGIDILKLEQGEINLLSTLPGVFPGSVQKIVDDARNTHLYQVASPKPAVPPTPAPKP